MPINAPLSPVRPRVTLRHAALLVAILFALLISTTVFLAGCSSTPRITPTGGRSPVALLEKIELGGVKQATLIRGHDAGAPILLFLHGGPGMPMMYLAHTFQRELEKDFLIVHWDQRGAGKSFSSRIPVDSIRVSRYLDDLEELVGHLHATYGERKIFLAGHSWGTYLGMLAVQRRPELYEAYIGIGQIVSATRAREIQQRFIREEALRRDVPEAIAELDAKGHAAVEKWLFRFNAELHAADSYQPLIDAGLKAKEYSLFDALNISKGVSFVGTHMKYDVIEGDLEKAVTRVDVPVYFFLGRHDFTTPSTLAQEYADKLAAPSVRVIWFERSAHFPFFEEPEAFTNAMRQILAELTGPTKHVEQATKTAQP